MEDLAGSFLITDLGHMAVYSSVWRRPDGACEIPYNLSSVRKEDLNEVICMLKLTGKKAYRNGGHIWGII